MADYDKVAGGCDAVVGNGLYNRLIWGVTESDYADMARKALSLGDGPALDCGCGSLVFTAPTYRQHAPHDLLLYDRSLVMLRRARRRLERPALQGSALDMPFPDVVFALTMAWGLGHLFGSRSVLISELARVTKPSGIVVMSVIMRSERWIGNAMLRQLIRSGEAAESERQPVWEAAFGRYFDLTDSHSIGNMLFLFGTKLR